jgi:hypothetical protein
MCGHMYGIAAGLRLAGNIVMARVSWGRRAFLFCRPGWFNFRDLIAIGYYHFLCGYPERIRRKLMKLFGLGRCDRPRMNAENGGKEGGFIAGSLLPYLGFITPPIGVHCPPLFQVSRGAVVFSKLVIWGQRTDENSFLSVV